MLVKQRRHVCGTRTTADSGACRDDRSTSQMDEKAEDRLPGMQARSLGEWATAGGEAGLGSG